MHRRTDERGSTLPFLVLTIVLAGVIVLGLGRVGGAATARAGAAAAADAAALAGAASGRAAAAELAAANGAELLSYQEVGNDTEVRVRLGPAEATGRARRTGDRDDGTGAGTGPTKGLAPAMRAALGRAEQLLGQKVPITSGWRSTEAQAALYANRAANPYPVAAPGSSMHERGLAIDVPADFVPRLLAVAPKSGLCQPYPADDPIHFEVCR